MNNSLTAATCDPVVLEQACPTSGVESWSPAMRSSEFPGVETHHQRNDSATGSMESEAVTDGAPDRSDLVSQ